MIKRIVKMTFKPEEVQSFEAIFAESGPLIRKMEGCLHLELWRDIQQPQVFFTYSLWNSTSNLDAYRNSQLFVSTWAKTKPLFAQKAEAWSVNMEVQHP